VIVPAVAVNVADEALAATVTDAGTLSAVLLPESATTAPAAGAAPDRITVQVVLAFDDKDALAHVNEDRISVCGGVRAIEAVCADPL